MKSEWKVTSQYVGVEKIYQVYRLRDIDAVDHSGNREYVPKFITNDGKEAEAMAIAKNKETDNAEKILEAFNETYGNRYKSFEEIKNEYDVTEILDTWLRYEGIVGYTRDIIDLLGECEIYIEE